MVNENWKRHICNNTDEPMLSLMKQTYLWEIDGNLILRTDSQETYDDIMDLMKVQYIAEQIGELPRKVVFDGKNSGLLHGLAYEYP